jgi:hypothetical protein
MTFLVGIHKISYEISYEISYKFLKTGVFIVRATTLGITTFSITTLSITFAENTQGLYYNNITDS